MTGCRTLMKEEERRVREALEVEEPTDAEQPQHEANVAGVRPQRRPRTRGRQVAHEEAKIAELLRGGRGAPCRLPDRRRRRPRLGLLVRRLAARSLGTPRAAGRHEPVSQSSAHSWSSSRPPPPATQRSAGRTRTRAGSSSGFGRSTPHPWHCLASHRVISQGYALRRAAAGEEGTTMSDHTLWTEVQPSADRAGRRGSSRWARRETRVDARCRRRPRVLRTEPERPLREDVPGTVLIAEASDALLESSTPSRAQDEPVDARDDVRMGRARRGRSG